MFLDDLEIEGEDREKLIRLGAGSALALLLMRKASPEAFDDYVGRDRVEAITKALVSLLTAEEQKMLAGPLPKRMPLGARLRRRPAGAKPPPFREPE
jgi:hypothetical protein